MAWMAGLRRRMWLTAAILLMVALAALAVAQLAAAEGRNASRHLSVRLVPAAAETGALAADYTLERASLRDYVVDRRPQELQSYQEAAGRIPVTIERLSALIRGEEALRQRFAAVQAAHAAWARRLAEPELAAVSRGQWARAETLQASDTNRYLVRALQARVSELQEQITTEQAAVTGRLRRAQGHLLTALAATVVLIVAMAAGGLLAVRRWLLVPFTALRRASDAVAAGDHDIQVPTVGPTELADLGRSVETMRTRLLAAVTDREAAERRYRDLLETSPDATVQVAGDGSIVMVNAQAERLFGYRRQELVGEQVEALVPQAVRAEHPAHRADYFADPQFRPMGEGQVLRAVHRDGHEFPVEISLGPLSTEQGPIVSAAVRDISDRLAAQADRERLIAEAEQERVQRRLAQSQRLESLGQLVGGVAHDFNNLLNVILGYTGFVAEQVSDTAGGDRRWDATRADVEQIRGAAERAARLTHQLLAFGRREVTKPEVLHLNDIVTGVEQMLRRTLGEHIDLVTTLDPDPWPVKADPGHLEQVLVNLAVNARDAMPAGGKLSIDTENTLVDPAYAAARPGLQPGRYVRMRVADTGTGMDRDTLARVFEPFFTTKPKGQGTGLGLATVYGVITQAGGHPRLYSEPGMGTTFTALLPVTDETAVAADVAKAVPAPAHGETVLVAEDEESLREMVARILTRHGYQVRTATTARHALEQASDLDQPIHLLLTDVVMPTMLGREVAARAQAIRPDLRVLYMSGYAQEMLDTQGSLDPGVTLIEKPFTEDGLLSRIREVLDRD
jgi:hypothetical protein